jgi:tetratricopeptide (TPR) repeat protein
MLDGDATRLLRDGQPLRVRGQVLSVLRVLLRHNGQFVSYERMIAEAWHGTRVSRHAVDVTVYELRRTLAEFGTWISTQNGAHRLEPPKSDELVSRGWHFYHHGTRDSLARAIDSFECAFRNCPTDTRTLVGLSACHLELAIHGLCAPRRSYTAFLRAYERAVGSSRPTPGLRCNRAQGLHVFEHRVAAAEAEYLEAIDEDARLAPAYAGLATLYGTVERATEAIDLLDRGYLVDPLLPSLAVAEVNVRFWQRQFGAALDAGARAVRLHPYVHSARGAWAAVLQYVGRFQEALEQWRIALALSPGLTWMRAQEGVCLAHLRQHAGAMAILAELDRRAQSEYVDGCHVAVLCQSLGLRERAFSELARGRSDNAAGLCRLDVAPQMDPFRGDPRFESLVAAVRDGAGRRLAV